jgi:hypothetical protein
MPNTRRSSSTSDSMCSRKTLLGSEWYADYCLPLGGLVFNFNSYYNSY